MQQIQKLGRQKNYGRALDLLKQFMKQNTNNFEAYYQLGFIYRKMKQFDTSLKTFFVCIQLHPQHIAARKNIVDILHLQEKYEDAIKQAEQILKLDRKQYETNYSLGKIYLKIGNYQKSMQYFKNCIGMHPNDKKCDKMIKQLEFRIKKLNEIKNKPVEELKRKIRQIEEKCECVKTEKQQKGLCAVCYQAKATYAGNECGHLCLCEVCNQKISNYKCPLCMKKSKFIKILMI